MPMRYDVVEFIQPLTSERGIIMTIKIIVDSAADLSLDNIKRYQIAVVPQFVTFGDTSYTDGVDIDTATFYRLLASSPTLPKTAMPTSVQWEETFRDEIRQGATGLVTITISSELSSTFNTASLVAHTVSEETGIPIEVIDSKSANVGMGIPAIYAARLAATGAAIEEVCSIAQRMITHANIYFVVDTLEYLEKGGRIGKAQAFVGTLLSIKPILCIKDGIVTPLERIRSRPKALARVKELLREISHVDVVGIASTDAKGLDEMSSIASELYPGIPTETATVGPIVGTHAGPGAAGIYVTSTQ
jgi:DegV family protein with EDD domain